MGMEEEIFDPEHPSVFTPIETPMWISVGDYNALLALYRQTKFALELAEGDEGYREGEWMAEALKYGENFAKPVKL
jgi:hypothetical protein